MASLFENIIANMGYRNGSDFMLKYVLPLMGVIIVFFFAAMFILSGLPVYVPFIILGIGTIIVIAYPYMIFEKKRVNIEENLHLFITFAGTISTVDINRNILFKKVAERKNLGETANIAEKITYFSKKWTLGYAVTCRIMAKISPSKIFGDFLDRLAIMLDFGEGLDVFLIEEQDAIMDDYASNYKKSLENIKTVQEIFVALTMALGFMLAIALMLPLITGTNIEAILIYALLGMIVLDIGILVFVKNFIPKDKLCYTGKIIDDDTLELYRWIYICLPITAILAAILFFLGWFSFLTNVSIAIIPLFFVGLKAQILENNIVVKEKAYPAFIRAFGTAVEVKSGAIMAAILSLLVHDFGPLNKSLIALHRRLKSGNDKHQSWEYFNTSSGSNLMYEFTSIYAESIFLGGSSQKVAEIISKNFLRIISLRKLRQQLGSSMRGAFYGALVGFSAAAFVSAKITNMLGDLFTDPFGDAGGNPMAGIISDVTPGTFEVDMVRVTTYIAIMVIFHASISALVIKVVDGGNMYSSFFDICIMIWIGLVIALVVPFAIDIMLPGFAGMNEAVAATGPLG